jgi:hypothetical protein
MKFAPMAGLTFALAALTATGCGGKAESKGHGTHEATPATAPPTPDTTPIEALRTPAGLVLKIEPATSATPAAAGPAATPTPK